MPAAPTMRIIFDDGRHANNRIQNIVVAVEET